MGSTGEALKARTGSLAADSNLGHKPILHDHDSFPLTVNPNVKAPRTNSWRIETR